MAAYLGVLSAPIVAAGGGMLASMSFRVHCLALLTLIFVAACSNSTADPETEPATAGGGTAGGESEPQEEHIALTTTPVPVPAPAVPREELSETLQAFWTGIEESVAIRPPSPPQEATMEAVQTWAGGPFGQWMTQRRAALDALMNGTEVPDEPSHERAVAAGLAGYAYEDFAADIRGAPIPDSIASDPELLDIYTSSLDAALRPVANEAIRGYAFCANRIRAMGDESEWTPWRAYCVERGQEMIRVYRLDEQAPAPQSEAAGAETTDTDSPAEQSVQKLRACRVGTTRR